MAERGDGVEALLVGEEEEDVWSWHAGLTSGR
jgi:hypothetical protein